MGGNVTRRSSTTDGPVEVTPISRRTGRYREIPSKTLRMFKATEAKNRFGAIMKLIDDAKPVFIEKHGAAHAVVLDIDSYTALVEKARGPEEAKLDALRSEFEELYASMQTPKSRRAVDALLSATAEDLNKATSRPKSRG